MPTLKSYRPPVVTKTGAPADVIPPPPGYNAATGDFTDVPPPPGPLKPGIKSPGDVGPLDIIGPAAGMAAGGPGGMALGGALGMLGDVGKEAIVPAIVGALAKPGRTLPRFLGALGGNILGRAGLEAAQEAIAPTGKGPLTAGVEGAMKGTLPGIVQGGLGVAFGPARDTIRTSRATKRAHPPARPTTFPRRRRTLARERRPVSRSMGPPRRALRAPTTSASIPTTKPWPRMSSSGNRFRRATVFTCVGTFS